MCAHVQAHVGVVALIVVVSLSGCAAVSEPFKSVQQAVEKTLAPLAGASVSPAAANSTPARLVAAPAPEAPVSPAIQRAFDDASRALRAGRNEEAERGFRAIAQANPDLGGPHANLGVIYRQAGKLPEAAAEFEKATSLNPKQPVYFNQLGVTYRLQGQFDKARSAYERAIALDANYAAPLLNLGILNDLYLWDGPRALELYDRYLALSPGGDAQVSKWVADLKNRKPQPITVSRKEQP